MARNKLAGTKTGKSKSAKHYQENPEAAAKKDAYNTKYHNTSKRKKYRAGLNRKNHERGTYGNGDGKDLSHTTGGKLVQEDQSTNRKRNRGKKKKGGKRYPSLPKY